VTEANETRPPRQEQRPARPDVEEVAPGVARLQLPIAFPGLGHVNCYVLEDDRGVALIDPGLPGLPTWRRLKQGLNSIGIPVKRVHTVVVTHSHPDHFGQVPRFRKQGAEIITHRSFRTFLDPEAEADDDVLETADSGHDRQATDRTAGGDRSAYPFPAVTPWGGKPYELPLSRRIRYRAMRMVAGRFLTTPTPTRRVDDADVLHLGGKEWISVHTPGHTEDHLCLWDPADGVMISGDHVLPTITPHISGLSACEDPLSNFFDSLERMKTFDGVSTVLPAHGLAFDDLAGRADAIVDHHRGRLDTLIEAGDDLGDGTVEQYMKTLFKERSWGPMAESETYAHLQHLRFRNQADINDDGPMLRFRMRQ
jgi:glyoxylase-like metal-dependent hydrolase (beta-lactamase superfamily II)